MARYRSLRATTALLLLAILWAPGFVGGAQRLLSHLRKADVPKWRTQRRFFRNPFQKAEEPWEPYVKQQMRGLLTEHRKLPKKFTALEFEPQDWRYIRVLNTVDEYTDQAIDEIEKFYEIKLKDYRRCFAYYAVSEWSTYQSQEEDFHRETPIDARDVNVSLRLVDYKDKGDGEAWRLPVKAKSIDVVIFAPDAPDRLSPESYRNAFKEAARLLTEDGICIVFGKEADGDLPDTAAMFFTLEERREKSWSKYAVLHLKRKPLSRTRSMRESRRPRARIASNDQEDDDDENAGFAQSAERTASGVTSELLEDALLDDADDEEEEKKKEA